MTNEYNINIKWSLDGKPSYIYDVIMSLANELDKSLKIPMMKESKSDEEVRRILDNPAGIKIEELQTINVGSIDEKLGREVRKRLDSAYRYLSVKLSKRITERNGMGNKLKKNDDNISNKNRELKNTIISQYEVIKKFVEDCEKKEELSEEEISKLKYIEEVYSRALSETIENLFAMATEDTERAKIFPFEERKEVNKKISDLQDRIWLLTKDDQSKLNQQIARLQDQNKQLQRELNDKSNSAELSVKSKIIEKLGNLIKEVDDKTSQGGLGRAETRTYLKKVRDGLEKTVAELQEGVNTEYQNLQVQPSK